MRISKYILIGSLLAILGSACDEDYPTYADSMCNLNFVFYGNYNEVLTCEEVTEETRTSTFSFVYSGEEAVRDTVWYEISTMGDLSDQNRPIALQQIQVEGVENAVAGTHYVAFDSPEVVSLYVVPANANTTQIPVIFLRDDPNLKQSTVTLKFGFAENEYFAPGYDSLATRTTLITDRLAQPSNWSDVEGDFGTYGQQKHLLMIEWTDNAWDEEYIDELRSGDVAYRHYLAQWFKQKLEEENAKRLADPNIGDVYREADGTEVVFPGY